jgi:NADPH:quinone reductase-like Zn-dependent oxidoreductase
VKAWVVARYGPPDRLHLQDVPDPVPAAGEVVVRVRAIGLNFADCMARLGVYPRVPRPPFVPGMEVAGEIVSHGPGTVAPPVGTRVAAVPIFGGHAELVRVKAEFLRPLPPGTSFVEGASLAVTGLTADHGLFTVGRLRAGERVAITAAAGGVGTIAVQLAAHAGARVLAIASTPAKQALARELGAAEAVGYREYGEACRGGLDVVLDAVGGRYFRPGWRALAGDGRYVLYGFAVASGPQRIRWLHAALELLRMGLLAPSALVQPCRTLAGFNLSLVPELAAHLHERMARLQELIGRGALRPVIGAVLPFDRLPAAHALLQSRASTGQIVVAL